MIFHEIAVREKYQVRLEILHLLPESSDDAGKIEGKAVEFDFAVGKGEIAFDLSAWVIALKVRHE